MGERLHLELNRHGGTIVIGLAGQFDIHSAEAFDAEFRRIARESPRDVLVDLRRVDFVDSLGLRSLVRATDLAHRKEFRLFMVKGGEAVTRTLRLTGLDAALPLIDEPGELLSSPGSPAPLP